MTTIQSPAATPQRPVLWAQANLHVAGHQSPYRIAGAGRLVMALTHQLEPDFLGYCESLARDARVVVPTLCGTAGSLEVWLLGLVDLFGAGEVALVADRSAALEALAFAIAYPDRVTAMEFVWSRRTPRAEAALVPAGGRCLVSVAITGYIHL